MAGKGLVIPLSLNPRAWVDGMRVVDRSLEDLEDDLDEVEDAGDRLEKALADNFRDIARKADRAGKDVDDGLSKGVKGGRFGTVGAEVADEFSENFGEAIRAGNPAGALLETFTSLAPALGVLGIGAAVVAGIVNQFVQERQRITDAIRQAMNTAGDTTIEEQGYQTGSAYLKGLNQALADESAKRDALKERYGTDTFIEALQKAAEEADDLNVPLAGYVDLLTGSADQVRAAIRPLRDQKSQIDRQIDALEEKLDRQGALSESDGATLVALRYQSRELQTQIDAANDRIGQGKEQARVVNELYWSTKNVTDENVRAAAAAGGISYDQAIRDAVQLGKSLDYATRNRSVTVQANITGATSKANRILAAIDSGVLG